MCTHIIHIAALLTIGQLVGSERVPSVSDLEAGIRKTRGTVRYGSMLINSEAYSFRTGKKVLIEKATRKVWFDSAKMRVTWTGRSDRQDHDYVIHVCVPFAGKADSLYYNEGDTKPLNGRIVINAQNKNADYNRLLLDPSALGLYPMPMHAYSHYKLDSLLSRANFVGKVRTIAYEGNVAYEIVYEPLVDRYKKTQTTIRMVVVPGMGYSVPEVELSAIYKGKPHRQHMRIKSNKVGKSEIWFPTSIHYRNLSDGKLVDDDRSTISGAEFEAAPPASVFSLRDMAIPAGAPVIINYDGRVREWNGKEIVDRTPTKKEISAQFPDLPPEGQSRWSVAWLVTAGGCLAAGGMVITLSRVRRHLEQRRSKT